MDMTTTQNPSDVVDTLGYDRTENGYDCRHCGQHYERPQADGRVLRAHRRNCTVHAEDVYEPQVCR